MKTRAVFFPEAKRYEMTELHLPEPGPEDVVVRTLITAISPGTERWVLLGKHIGTQFPCVPGYQRVGIVEDRGNGVTTLQKGDVVYAYGSAGRWQDKIVSMWGAHVGLSVGNGRDYKYLSSSMPDRTELETLAYATIAGVANRGIRFCEVHDGQKVLIIGAGIIGICAAQLAAFKGAIPVIIEKNEERRVFVQGLGLDALSVDDKELDEKLNGRAPAGFDIIYDTVGHAGTTDRLIGHAHRQGTLLLQAQYFSREACALDLDQIKIKELTIKTTCGVGDIDFADTFHNIRQRHLQIAPLITHRFASADALEGYKLLQSGSPFNLGIIFDWSDCKNGWDGRKVTV